MHVRFGDCVFDTTMRTLRCRGEEQRISGKAFQLLEILLESRPNPIAKETLFDRLWPQTFVSEANLASLIKEIRAAIGDDARNARLIRTVHRFGYAFSGDAVEVETERKPLDSLAVLPFENLTSNPDLDYLADGIAENLINMLSTVPRLRVSPRAASFRYRGRDGELELLARELNVRGILSGRIRLRDTNLVLQLELIDLAEKDQIWGARIERPLSDTLHVHEEVARQLVNELTLRSDGARPPKTYPTNNEAYQLYLRGRHHWNRRTLEGIERGIFYFRSAIDLDPSFAPAWSGLADSYIALGSRDLFPPTQLFPKAEEAAKKALELDPELAEAHGSVGALNEVFEWNWNEAETSFERALKLNPSYVTARQWYALGLAHRGRFDEALAQLDRALEQDPLSWMLNTNIGVVLYLARRFDDAVTAGMKALEINPHYEPAHLLLGLVYEQRAEYEPAAAELDKAVSISKQEPHAVAARGHLAGRTGAAEAAEQALAQLRSASQVRYVSPVHLALVELGLGRNDAVLDLLERALEERSGWLVYLGREPRFDVLREEERFRRIVKVAGL